jgi:hypothetical protein
MVKKSNLAEAFQKIIAEKPGEVKPDKTNELSKVIVSYIPPSRRGKLAISGSYDPEVKQQLKRIALDKDTTIQQLLCEALNGIFIKYGKPPIAK